MSPRISPQVHKRPALSPSLLDSLLKSPPTHIFIILFLIFFSKIRFSEVYLNRLAKRDKIHTKDQTQKIRHKSRPANKEKAYFMLTRYGKDRHHTHSTIIFHAWREFAPTPVATPTSRLKSQSISLFLGPRVERGEGGRGWEGETTIYDSHETGRCPV